MTRFPDLEKTIETTKAAGRILLEKFETDLEIDLKGRDEVVTESDRESEAFLHERLMPLLPGSGFYGEETGYHPGESGWTWVVDPLDGTHNYSIGIPLWACSVGLLDEDRVPVLGVLDFPTLKVTLRAKAGEGAFCNGKRMKVDASPLLPTSVIGVQSKIRLEEFPPHVEYASRHHSARSLGAIAYHAYLVASGRMRAAADLKVKLHDIVAATVIIEEAGGLVTDIDGAPIFPLTKDFEELIHTPLPFFAGDPETGPDLLQALFPAGTPAGVFEAGLSG